MQQNQGIVQDNRGRFMKSATYVDRMCIVCKTSFKIKESSLKYGRGKYCSRKCCDKHKIGLYVGEHSSMFGRKASIDQRKKRAEFTTEMWANPHIRKNILDGTKRFVKENGYWPGSDKRSIKKRKETCLKKYGVDHVWKIKEIRKKCNDTCIKLYGKSMWQLMIESLKFYQTEIERITMKILDINNIKYTTQFQLWSDGNTRIYDFFIPSANLFIEVDGDFWHGNPKNYADLDLLEVQKANILNDKYKNELANKCGYNIVRFWESNIKDSTYSKILLDTIKKYENVTFKKNN